MMNYYYNALIDREKRAYDIIHNAAARRSGSCEIEGLSVESVKKAWVALIYDKPDLIDFTGAVFYPRIIGSKISVPLLYLDCDLNAYAQRFDRAVNKINVKLHERASDYFVCKTIFDYLASSVKYDYDAIDKYNKMNADLTVEKGCEFIAAHGYAFSAYGVFMQGKGVCEGIAKAFRLLCAKFGISCMCATATPKDGGNIAHLLNAVEIDGAYAYTDITNCLPVEGLPVIRYDYFLVPRSVIEKQFVLDQSLACDSEKISYFYKTGTHFKSAEAMRRYLSAYIFSSTNGAVRCYYDGGKLSDGKLRELFSETINAHCEQGKHMSGTYVSGGFCTGLITDDND